MKTAPKTAALTLIELLAAIAIVAILGVIGMGALNRVRASQRQTACVSNLRNAGLAMTLYTNDHNFRLPGPLWRGQSPIYATDEEGQFDVSNGNLSTFLGPYLHHKHLAPGHTAVADALACPAWLSGARPDTETVCYYSAGSIRLNAEGEEEEFLYPFGRSGGDPIEPTRITAVPDPANTPAFWEFDKRIVGEGFYLTDPRVPNQPVHKTLRNVLFFDGHVASHATGS